MELLLILTEPTVNLAELPILILLIRIFGHHGKQLNSSVSPVHRAPAVRPAVQVRQVQAHQVQAHQVRAHQVRAAPVPALAAVPAAVPVRQVQAHQAVELLCISTQPVSLEMMAIQSVHQREQVVRWDQFLHQQSAGELMQKTTGVFFPLTPHHYLTMRLLPALT